MSQALETAKLVLAEVARSKTFTETKQISEIFLSAETIVSGLAYLLGAKLEAEHAYRTKRQQFIAEGDTAAAAEAKAKATEDYVLWRKLEGVYALGEQRIQLLKKFGPLMYAEYGRS